MARKRPLFDTTDPENELGPIIVAVGVAVVIAVLAVIGSALR